MTTCIWCSVTASPASSTARPGGILDPEKITWSQVTDVDLSTRRSEVRMVPDNYQSLLIFSAWYELRSEGEAHVLPALRRRPPIRLPLLGPLAERAIGGSIRQNIAETARLVERYVSGQEATNSPDGRTPGGCGLRMTPTPDALDAVLAAELAAWPGQAAAGVVARPSPTGSPELVATYGPVDEIFRWASVTKLLVSLASMIAVEEGTVEPRGPSRAHRVPPFPTCWPTPPGLPFEGNRPVAPRAGGGSTPTRASKWPPPTWSRPPACPSAST